MLGKGASPLKKDSIYPILTDGLTATFVKAPDAFLAQDSMTTEVAGGDECVTNRNACRSRLKLTVAFEIASGT